MSFEGDLVAVWRQVMVDNAKEVTLNEARYPVRRTSRSKLRELDVEIAGRMLRAVEQNPETNSRWAQLAREGKKVIQFMENRRYVAVVVNGNVTLYGHRSGGKSS